MSTAVIVFPKAPVPALAKTRLAPALGKAGAAALAERMLRHAPAQAAAAWFCDMRWSPGRVMEETRQRMRAAGERWMELPPLADIGGPVDLMHLPPGLLDGLQVASPILEPQP